MIYRDAAQRHRNDPVFRRYVDMMTAALEEMHLTPGEMRDAAMLASINFEARNAGPLYISAAVNAARDEREDDL